MKSVTLSGYQYKLLNELARIGTLTIDQAALYNQTTFGSFLRRQYLTFDRKKHVFILTENAHNAMQFFRRCEIMRQIESSKLSIYFKNGTR